MTLAPDYIGQIATRANDPHCPFFRRKRRQERKKREHHVGFWHVSAAPTASLRFRYQGSSCRVGSMVGAAVDDPKRFLPDPYFFRAMPRTDAIRATCAYCSLSAAAYASTPIGAAGCPTSASLSPIDLSSSAESTSAAMRRRKSIGMSRGPSRPKT